MQVHIQNDGPVTIEIESPKKEWMEFTAAFFSLSRFSILSQLRVDLFARTNKNKYVGFYIYSIFVFK